MHRRIAALAAALVAVTLPAGAQAAVVSYIDGNQTWLSSPDGVHKQQLTSGGTDDRPWGSPVQTADGRTLTVRRESLEGSTRPVLYLYGADRQLVTANVMPVYSGANIPVYPIGMDVDWNGNAVAYGYSYCTFACGSTVRGYWLTFSDNQGAFPTDPQGQSDAHFPTFHGTRVISSDSGGSLFIQPDVPEAPFTNSSSGWLAGDSEIRFTRAATAMTGRQVAIQFSQYDPSTSDLIGDGILVGNHQGSLPSDVTNICVLPTAADPASVSFSPDGTQIAWKDAQGVRVAGAPNLAAGSGTCTLSSPPVLISAGGRSPDLGGGDLTPATQGPGGGQPGTGDPGTGQPGSGDPGTGPGTGQPGGGLEVSAPKKLSTSAFKRGIQLNVTVPGAGRISATGTVPSRIGRRLRPARAATLAALARVRGLSAAKRTVVAKGAANATAAGSVKLKLKPTKKARRRARKLRGATIAVRVVQGGAVQRLKIRLR